VSDLEARRRCEGRRRGVDVMIDMSSITTQRPVDELHALLEARRHPAA